jgi:DNA-binding transcriptional LysR family regulator
LSLDDVATFVQAAESGSFAAAARRLGVPKGTVSRRVARLEAALGEQLIIRHARLFELTDVGKGLFERSAAAVRDLERATKEVVDAHDGLAGELRLSVPPDIGGSAPLLKLLAGFCRAHPDVTLSVDLSERHVDLVAEQFDFAIRAHGAPLQDTAALRVRRLAPAMPLQLWACPAYLEGRAPIEVPEDLGDHDLVGFGPLERSSIWPLASRASGREQRISVRPRVRFSSFAAVLAAAAAGFGVAPLPSIAAAALAARGELIPVLPDWTLGVATLSLLWPASSLPHPRRRAFLDYVREHPPFDPAG